MEKLPPEPEMISEELRAFYDYISGGEFPEKEGRTNYRIFQIDVNVAYQKINKYIEENDDTKADVLFMGVGSRVPLPWLSACDPEGNLFFVIQSEP